MKRPFELGWPSSPDEYTSIIFTQALTDENVEVGAEGVVVDSTLGTDGSYGYLIEVGPWNEHGAPTTIVCVTQEFFKLRGN